MQNEVKKITRLIDEVTSVLMKHGSKEIDVKIKRDNDLSIIYIVDYNTTYTDEDISDLNDILNIQRQCEMEGFYWELVGEDNHGDELFLVGTMIDCAKVEKRESNLYIEMSRMCKHRK
ncbi:MAG: hypothetical protein ACRDD7_13430 [Peptostreptococcaceae bacterium]